MDMAPAKSSKSQPQLAKHTEDGRGGSWGGEWWGGNLSERLFLGALPPFPFVFVFFVVVVFGGGFSHLLLFA